MDIREALLKEHSKKQTLRIASYIGDDKKKFDLLVNLVVSGEEQVSQRAAWVMTACAEAHPMLIAPNLGRLIPLLKKNVHDAVKRNIIRILQYQEIPLKLQGSLAGTLFDILQSPAEPIAIKAFSMSVLLNICRKHKALKRELSIVISDMLPFAGPGLRSRGKKVLMELNNL